MSLDSINHVGAKKHYDKGKELLKAGPKQNLEVAIAEISKAIFRQSPAQVTMSSTLACTRRMPRVQGGSHSKLTLIDTHQLKHKDAPSTHKPTSIHSSSQPYTLPHTHHSKFTHTTESVRTHINQPACDLLLALTFKPCSHALTTTSSSIFVCSFLCAVM